MALPGPVHGRRLTEELLRKHAAGLPGAVFYVTGPAGMVSDVHAMLRTIGVTRNHIRSVAQGYVERDQWPSVIRGNVDDQIRSSTRPPH